MKDQAFIERLQLCTEIVGSTAGLARAAGISQSGIRKYFDGAEPTRPVLIGLAKGAGVNLLWLSLGNGPVCHPSSPVITAAQRVIADEFKLALGFATVASVEEEAEEYCNLYNSGRYQDVPARWVHEVLPKIHPEDLLKWRKGEFAGYPKYATDDVRQHPNPKHDDWIEAPAEVVVAVGRELRKVFGGSTETISQRKEAYVVRSVVDFLLTQSGIVDSPSLDASVLQSQIKFAAFMYDKEVLEM